MKNLSLLLNILLSIAIVILFYLHFSLKNDCINKTNTNDSTKTKTPLVIDLKPSQFVYINSDTLWANFEMVKELKKEIESQRKTSDNSFQAKVKAFQAEIQNLQENASSLTQEQGEAKQIELAQKEQQLGEMQAQLQEQLLEKETDKNRAIQKFISDYLKINYSDKYTYILGYSEGGGILLANDSLNITNEVIIGLNAAYKTSKKTKK